PFEGGESIDSLALQLYSLGVWQLLMLPGLTEPELNQLLDIVTMEPGAILREGGVRGLLVKYGIEHVRVLELRPGDEDPANVTLETYHRLLSGSLTAQERAALVGALRAGPEQAAGVLSIIIERTKQAFADASGPGLGTRVYGALTALDRAIVDAAAAVGEEHPAGPCGFRDLRRSGGAQRTRGAGVEGRGGGGRDGAAARACADAAPSHPGRRGSAGGGRYPHGPGRRYRDFARPW